MSATTPTKQSTTTQQTATSEQALRAADLALPLLPLPSGGETAPATLADIPATWPAVSRAFAGSRSGVAAVVLDPAAAEALTAALTGALADAAAAGTAAANPSTTPGDLAQACLPALDAMSTSLGPTAGQAPEATTGADLVARWNGGDQPAVVVISVAGTPQAYLILALAPAEARVPTPRGNDETDFSTGSRGMDLLRSVPMEVTAEIGRTRMTIQELLSLSPGAVVELDRPVGSPADVLVNGRLFARGEVVVVDEDFAIRITEIVDPAADTGSS